MSSMRAWRERNAPQSVVAATPVAQPAGRAAGIRTVEPTTRSCQYASMTPPSCSSYLRTANAHARRHGPRSRARHLPPAAGRLLQPRTRQRERHAPHELGVKLIAHSVLHGQRARRVDVDVEDGAALAQRVGNHAASCARHAGHAGAARTARYGGRASGRSGGHNFSAPVSARGLLLRPDGAARVSSC